MQFNPGDQIAYVPTHANGDLSHPDVEFGFVTSQSIYGAYFCRYWSKYTPNDLRTKSCGELTPAHLLVPHVSHTPEQIEAMWARYMYHVGI